MYSEIVTELRRDYGFTAQLFYLTVVIARW